MKIVMKYKNRKLYDTEMSRYISVAELAKLPLDSFKVEKHLTGEDVTTDTLLGALTSENVGSEIKVQVMKHCISELQNGVEF